MIAILPLLLVSPLAADLQALLHRASEEAEMFQQNITLVIGAPSLSAPDGYSFFVPGVESARMELIVP